MPSKGMLIARNLSKHYGGVHALEGVGLEMRAGEIFAGCAARTAPARAPSSRSWAGSCARTRARSASTAYPCISGTKRIRSWCRSCTRNSRLFRRSPCSTISCSARGTRASSTSAAAFARRCVAISTPWVSHTSRSTRSLGSSAWRSASSWRSRAACRATPRSFCWTSLRRPCRMPKSSGCSPSAATYATGAPPSSSSAIDSTRCSRSRTA